MSVRTIDLAIDRKKFLEFINTAEDLTPEMIADTLAGIEGSLSEKQAISGHRNMGQTARYDRKIKVVPVVGNQKK